MSLGFKYAAKNEAPIYETMVNGVGKKIVNRILMGTYVTLIEEVTDYFKVYTVGDDGWMKKADLTDNMGLKLFYLDVGQGDGVLIEVGNLKILVDAGPGKNMHGYLTKFQYSYLIKAGKKVHIDYVFVSHFDIDHYKGLIEIMKNQNFTFGTVFHPGILKFAKSSTYNTGLGNVTGSGTSKLLTTYFEDLLNHSESNPFNRDVTNFMEQLQLMHNTGRIADTKRLEAGDTPINLSVEGKNLKIDILGPFIENTANGKGFKYFNSDEGKTVNGHSLVIKLTFGQRTFLLGGDLNSSAEKYLMEKYGASNPFEVDLAKSCHHGSSDFEVDFMKKINPFATVISSGDNEGHAHPRADAIGCAGKYARGSRPLVFSTELARSVDMRTRKILFGMINVRCNGDEIHISQMKEVKKYDDLWDSYSI